MKNLRAFLLSALVLCSGVAAAQTAALSFQRPVTRIDGSALPAAEIRGYDVECSGWTPTGGARTACTQFPLVSLGAASTGGTLTGTVPAAGGQACFRVRTVDTGSRVSDWTPEACKTFAAVAPPPVPPPNPPGHVTVAVVVGINMAPVYRISTAGLRLDPVIGFVPVGLQCTGAPAFNYRSRAYRRIEQLPVKWWGSAPTASAAVPCT